MFGFLRLFPSLRSIQHGATVFCVNSVDDLAFGVFVESLDNLYYLQGFHIVLVHIKYIYLAHARCLTPPGQVSKE